MKTPGITLYDTTLRDGTQGTGISFSLYDKLRIAEKLDDFGIHYIEAGFPGSNPKDAEFFREAKTRTWRHSKLSAFGATRRGQLKVEDDPQVRVLLEAETPVVTIVGKTWPVQVVEVLGVTLEENLEMIRDTVAYLKSHGREVLYDAEHFFDSLREDYDYSLATLKTAHLAGADLLVLCDTNGGAMPEFVTQATQTVVRNVASAVGIHTHNDGGLGVANALAAFQAGATQIQGTINGYGERVGNCDLITIIASLQLKLGTPVVQEMRRLREVSLFVDELANMPPHPRAPYVGSAAFIHKGGQHVHAVRKLASSYEHIDPELVGNRRAFAISDLSGQANILSRLEQLGIQTEKGHPAVTAILAEVKRLEHEGYEFEAAEGSFVVLVRRMLGLAGAVFEAEEYSCSYRKSSGSQVGTCEATVKLIVDGVLQYTVAEGHGPIHALDAALRKALRPRYPQIDAVELGDFKVRILNGQQGAAARTRVFIDTSDGQTRWSTVGVSYNIIEASWIALLDSFRYYLGHSGASPVS